MVLIIMLLWNMRKAIGKRGNNIENYLIKPNPNGQLLMELY